MIYENKEYDFNRNHKLVINESYYNIMNPDFLILNMISQDKNNIENDLLTIQKIIQNVSLKLQIGYL